MAYVHLAQMGRRVFANIWAKNILPVLRLSASEGLRAVGRKLADGYL